MENGKRNCGHENNYWKRVLWQGFNWVHCGWRKGLSGTSFEGSTFHLYKLCWVKGFSKAKSNCQEAPEIMQLQQVNAGRQSRNFWLLLMNFGAHPLIWKSLSLIHNTATPTETTYHSQPPTTHDPHTRIRTNSRVCLFGSVRKPNFNLWCCRKLDKESSVLHATCLDGCNTRCITSRTEGHVGWIGVVWVGDLCTLQAIAHSDIPIPHLWRFIHLLAAALAGNSFASLAKVTRISKPLAQTPGKKINLRLYCVFRVVQRVKTRGEIWGGGSKGVLKSICYRRSNINSLL